MPEHVPLSRPCSQPAPCHRRNGIVVQPVEPVPARLPATPPAQAPGVDFDLVMPSGRALLVVRVRLTSFGDDSQLPKLPSTRLLYPHCRVALLAVRVRLTSFGDDSQANFCLKGPPLERECQKIPPANAKEGNDPHPSVATGAPRGTCRHSPRRLEPAATSAGGRQGCRHEARLRTGDSVPASRRRNGNERRGLSPRHMAARWDMPPREEAAGTVVVLKCTDCAEFH
ncbi:uncharacterized protein LOC123448485 [Hordeum vulgare subsp. vulgare]|uniref:uncharacterized protein LOC123448485 n=1 Tax=Hordeum vulgare subsp. vulgare TaxID=112509 RepID=UPI001D1A3945|nr:uncharacterized protein LOC123448485 [Hordeum vulgare subsp. vulgare]